MSETAGARLTRLLALVPWLCAHDGVTITEAAEHFGVTPAELERDLWLLVVSGLPGHGPDQLVDIDFWDDGVIHVLDPQTLERPLRLTPDEAMTLLVALRTLAQVPGIADRSVLVSAAAKVESAVEGAVSLRDLPEVQVLVDPDVANHVDAAVVSGDALLISYASGSRDDVTERVVQPESVHVINGVGYLEAWCSTAQARRTFRLDRILSAQGAESPVQQEPAQDEAEPAPLEALLAVTPEAAWVIDTHHAARSLGPDDRGRRLVSIPLHSLDWGTRLVLSLNGQAEAIEPPELVTAVASAAASALQAYSGRIGSGQ